MTKTTAKKLKKIYYLYMLGTVLFMMVSAFVIAVFELPDSFEIMQSADVIKTIQMIITLFGIPGIFGLFSKQVEAIRKSSYNNKLEDYVKPVKLRIKVVAIIFALNAVVYFLISEQSQLIMVAISAFVFLFTRPSENRIISDLGLNDGISDE